MRLARTVQHLLPIVLLVIGYLELSALVPVPFDTLGVGGTAAMLGPASFLPLSLAVVWAALLPATGVALLVKAITAVGALGFAAARVALAALWWRDAADPGWSTGVLTLSGLLLGASLAVWSVVDAQATRAALRGTSPQATPPIAAAALHGGPAPSQSVLPASPSTPTRPASPSRSRNTVPGTPPAPAEPVWQSVSTPWPRRDEADPDGTLIRPPGRLRHHR